MSTARSKSNQDTPAAPMTQEDVEQLRQQLNEIEEQSRQNADELRQFEKNLADAELEEQKKTLEKQIRACQKRKDELRKEKDRLLIKAQNAEIITPEKMTQVDLDRFKEQLKALRKELKELRVYKGSDAIHQGDTWHDNPTLYQAEAQEQALLRQIAELEKKIRYAEVVEVPDDVQHVVLGCRVRIRFPDGDEEDYQIMGEASANPSKRVISDKSPLGQALMGKSVGDKVTYQAGNSSHRVKIITIEPA